MPMPLLDALVRAVPLLLAASVCGQEAKPADDALLQRLKSHRYFSKVTFKVDATVAPYRFLLPAPLKADDTQYDRSVVNPVLPFLNRLRAEFDAAYGAPNDMAPRPDMQPYSIAVLTSRGSYDDYARATRSSSLHQSLAHYNSDLKLAVTYRDPFGASNAREERTSILHEFVHALQHAYSTTGRMPKPLWFNEGLAEYRSCSTSMAASLADPPLNEQHAAVVFALGRHATGRKLLLPLEQLVGVEGYEQIVAIAQQNGVAEGPLDPVGAFYAQSEMLVRFLHVGEGGKHRPAFVRYFAAVEGGADGLPAFRAAFGVADAAALAALDAAFRTWADATFAAAKGLPVEALASTAAAGLAALAPPSAFDAATLAWQDADAADRLDLARRHCRAGEFAAALAALPAKAGADEQARLDAERKRIQELVALRETLVRKLQQATGNVDLGGGRRGRFLRLDGDLVVLAGKDGEQAVPFDAKAMLAVGLNPKDKDKVFEFSEVRKAIWLHWLAGDFAAAQSLLKGKTFTWVDALAAEIRAPLAPDAGAAAAELARFLATPLPDDRAGAQAMLERLRASVASGHAVWQRRKEAVGKLTQALAERAFAADDPAALGIRGAVTRLPDDRIKVTYPDPASAPDADFRLVEDPVWQFDDRTQIAYDGPTCVRIGDRGFEVIGNGVLEWAVPLTGPHEVEFDFQLPGANATLLLFAAVADQRWLLARLDGQLAIRDRTRNIDDEQGGGAVLYVDKKHRLRLVNDGAKVATLSIDGKRLAQLPAVGNCTSGAVVLMVRSSAPIPIRNLTITGRLLPPDPGALRERFVQRWLQDVWRPAAGPAGSGK